MHDKAEQAGKFEKLIADAMAQGVAEIRFDPPDHSTNRNLVYGPDHKVVKAASPRKEAAVLNLGGTYIAETDYDDDDMFGEEDDDDVETVPSASIAERNEVRKEEILTGVSARAWQDARERVNNHEKIYCMVPEERLSTIAKIREKFWYWLQQCRSELMTVGSATDATLDEAMSEWGVTEAST